MVVDLLGTSRLPLGCLPVAHTMAERKLANVSRWAARARGLACIRTAGRCPPVMLTRPTPDTCDSFCATRMSIRSRTSYSGKVGEVTARLITAVSAGLTLLQTGGAGESPGSRLDRSDAHTSELQSHMRIPYAVFCLKKKIDHIRARCWITHR